jgi:hypothetical protein
MSARDAFLNRVNAAMGAPLVAPERQTLIDAGREDLAREIAAKLDEMADADGSVSGADALCYLAKLLARLGAVESCLECGNDYSADATVCPYCAAMDDDHDLSRCDCERCDEDRHETNYGGPRK